MNRYNCEDELPRQIFEHTDCVLVLSSNDYYVPYLSTLLESIRINTTSSKNYDIIILTRDISPHNREILCEQMSNNKNISVRFTDVSESMRPYDNLYTRGHFRIETYYRFLIPEILSDYSKVLYLDSDMIVTRDIADLYSEDIEDYVAGVCRDADTAGLYNGFEPGKKDYIDNMLKIKDPYKYFQAGTILFNLDRMRKEFTSKAMLDFATSYNWELLDQDVLNYFFQNKVKFIDMGWNVMMDWRYIRKDQIIALAPDELYREYLDAREKRYIIHYAGPDKPWDDPESDFATYFWKYARETPYYEAMILRLQSNKVDNNHVVTVKGLIEQVKRFVSQLIRK